MSILEQIKRCKYEFQLLKQYLVGINEDFQELFHVEPQAMSRRLSYPQVILWFSTSCLLRDLLLLTYRADKNHIRIITQIFQTDVRFKE